MFNLDLMYTKSEPTIEETEEEEDEIADTDLTAEDEDEDDDSSFETVRPSKIVVAPCFA